MRNLSILTIVLMALGTTLHAGENGKHLFILSGQSNMNHLDPNLSFTPTVAEEFGKENVIVVKYAEDARRISLWYKNCKNVDGTVPDWRIGDAYDKLMEKVDAAIKGKEIATVTFVWMQGERDAKIKEGPVYADSLKGLVAQLSKDLKRDDVNVVIGRINDHSMDNRSHPHWTLVREAQVQVADELPRAVWVDTDDLNGRKNDIHATEEGFVNLGKRFAEKSIALIKTSK